MTCATPLPAVVRLTRSLAVGSALALIALGLAWELVLAKLGTGALALKVLPLAAPLAGLLKNRLYTYRWVTLLAWLYVGEGAVRASTERGIVVPLALAEIALSLVLFGACAAQVRWRLRHASRTARAEEPSGELRA